MGYIKSRKRKIISMLLIFIPFYFVLFNHVYAYNPVDCPPGFTKVSDTGIGKRICLRGEGLRSEWCKRIFGKETVEIISKSAYCSVKDPDCETKIQGYNSNCNNSHQASVPVCGPMFNYNYDFSGCEGQFEVGFNVKFCMSTDHCYYRTGTNRCLIPKTKEAIVGEGCLESAVDSDGNLVAMGNECVFNSVSFSECEEGDGDSSGTYAPPPQSTCHELCMGEGRDDDGKSSTLNDFHKGENYNSCCRCVCGVEDCPTDLAESDSYLTGNIWTEVGCINASEKGVVIAVMRVFLGVVTTIALFRFIQAAIMMNTDDPEKIKEGKSIFASALAAIFAAVFIPIILNFIGISILGTKVGEIFKIFKLGD